MNPCRNVPLLLAVLWLSPATTASAENGIADRIAPFLGSRTLVVGHVDVTKIDVDGLLDLVEMTGEDVPDEGSRQAGTLVASFVAAGASDIFVLWTWDDLGAMPVVVVPAKQAGAVGALANLLQSDGIVTEYFRGAVVIGRKGAVSRLRAVEPTERPDLAAAIGSTEAATGRIVLASGPEERRALRALLPTFPQPVGERFRLLVTKAKWFALAADTTPPAARVVAAMPDGESAARMHALQTDILERLRATEYSRHVPDLSRTAGAITSTRSGQRVVLSVASTNVRDFVESLQPVAERVRRRLTRTGPGRSLKQIGLAFHNFHDTFEKLPARASVDEDGKPLLSWRVHILPFLGEKELYEQFRLDEPWDSPHNKALLPKMPKVYARPDGRPGMTNYVVPVGEGTLFEGTQGIAFREITDGTSVTILVVSGARAVPWTKPADLEVDFEKPKAGLVAPKADGVLVVIGDGSVRWLSADLTAEELRSLLTMAGGERILVNGDGFVFPE